MTCREVTDSLADLLAGELPRARHLQLKHHLLACTSCAAYRRSYADTVKLEQEAFSDPEETDALPESLVRAILCARRLAIPPAGVP